MKLEIIKYKKFRAINRYVFYCVYIIIFINFLLKINFPTLYFENERLINNILFTIGGTYIFLNFIIIKTKSIGGIYLKNNKEINIEVLSNFKNITANRIVMFYGGHNKELFSYFEMFVNGYRFRNGTDNYIVINDEVYQIYLDDIIERNKLKEKLLELEEIGVNVEWKKTYFGKRLSRKYIGNK